MLKMGLKILVLILIIFWIGIVIVDYLNAKNSRDGSFCWSEEVKVYDKSGNVQKTYNMQEFSQLSDEEKKDLYYTYVCKGLGYKIYRYHREFNAIEFGPFFISERQNAN